MRGRLLPRPTPLMMQKPRYGTTLPCPAAQHSQSNGSSHDDTKTLLDCCHCAQEFFDEYDVGDRLDVGELNLMRVAGRRSPDPCEHPVRLSHRGS